MVEKSAEQRAAEAAESLSAEGASVTARAVRERSGVKMSVAADAARQWNEHQASLADGPDVPVDVQTRFDAAWRAAYSAARADFDEARTGWQQRLDKAAAEHAQLADDFDRTEAERDQAIAELTAAQAQATKQQADLTQLVAEQRSRADRAEATTIATAAERDRLIAERDQLLATVDHLKDELRDHRP